MRRACQMQPRARQPQCSRVPERLGDVPSGVSARVHVGSSYNSRFKPTKQNVPERICLYLSEAHPCFKEVMKSQ